MYEKPTSTSTESITKSLKEEIRSNNKQMETKINQAMMQNIFHIEEEAVETPTLEPSAKAVKPTY